MDVRYTLRSLQQILDKIPFNNPVSRSIDLSFSKLAVPYYVKNVFNLSIEYESSLPYEASCSIYSPKNKVTVVIVMRKEYEDSLKAYNNGDISALDRCCLRREIYCHEVCHLIAIIRAYSSNRDSRVREEFKQRIEDKFTKSMGNAVNKNAVPWDNFAAIELQDTSPSAFDKEHFRYADDSLNYFQLFEGLMLPEDKMYEAAKKLADITRTKTLNYSDVAKETFVSKRFFDLFPDKRDRLNELIVEELNK